MFSSKGHITRQKKIDIAGLNSSGQTPCDSFSSHQEDFCLEADKYDSILNRTLNDLSLEVSTSEYDEDHKSNEYDNSNDYYKIESLGDELFNRSTSPYSDSELSTKAINKKTNSATSRHIKSEKNDLNNIKTPTPSIDTKTITNRIVNSNKVHLSTALKERLLQAKSPSTANSKQLLSTNSLPANQPPKRRLANLMRISYQASAFFSRSCPGEEITQNQNDAPNKEEATDSNNKTYKVNGNHLTVNNKMVKQNSIRDETSNNTSSSSISSHQKLTKSLLSFANRAGIHSKNKKNTDSNSSSPLASGSVSSSINGIDENSSLSNNNSKNGINMIGNYEVDFEKLARELVLPSMNAPLTSFKSSTLSQAEISKPVLQASITIDVSPDKEKNILNCNKKQITRSLTQNR